MDAGPEIAAPRRHEGLGTGGAPGVKFVFNPPACKSWLLAATQGVQKPNAIVSGSTIDFQTLLLNIMRAAGPGLQYFTYEGHLYKFWYTGYDTKTGKYNEGGKNTIYVCTDGMSVLANPDSGSSYIIVPSTPSGLVLQTHSPRREPYHSPKSLFSSGSGKKESSMQSAFSVGVRGLGRRAPRGLGQDVSQYSAGPNGTVTLTNQPASWAQVNESDWMTFYEGSSWPGDDDAGGFRANTNLAMNTNDQAQLGLGSTVFHDSNPVGQAVVNQITAAGQKTTQYWTLWDPNNRAAYTIGPLQGNVSGDGSAPATAFIRSSWVGNTLKLEIATRVAAASPSAFASWPGLAHILSAADAITLYSGYTWLQAYGPITGSDIAQNQMTVSLSGNDLSNAVSIYYDGFLAQPSFLQGIPSYAWGAWYNTSGGNINGPVPIPSSVPSIYFEYGGQIYRMWWTGTWSPLGGIPPARTAAQGVVIEVCKNPPSALLAKYGLNPPKAAPASLVPGARVASAISSLGPLVSSGSSVSSKPSGASSAALPGGAGGAVTPGAQGGVASTYTSLPAPVTATSNTTLILGAILGFAIVGGVLYYVFE